MCTRMESEVHACERTWILMLMLAGRASSTFDQTWRRRRGARMHVEQPQWKCVAPPTGCVHACGTAAVEVGGSARLLTAARRTRGGAELWHALGGGCSGACMEVTAGGADLGLLGGDVARAADAVAEIPVPPRDEGRGDAGLTFANARSAPEVVAVHERQILHGRVGVVTALLCQRPEDEAQHCGHPAGRLHPVWESCFTAKIPAQPGNAFGCLQCLTVP